MTIKRDNPKQQVLLTTWAELAVYVLFFAAMIFWDVIAFTRHIAHLSFVVLEVLLALIGILSAIRAPTSTARHVGLAAIAIAVVFAVAAFRYWDAPFWGHAYGG
jgi:hypothetical protein